MVPGVLPGQRERVWAGFPGMHLLPFPSDSGGATPLACDMPVALIVDGARSGWDCS